MVEEKFARYLYELKNKYYNRLTEWEKTFVADVAQKDRLSLSQKNVIQRIINEAVTGKPDREPGRTRAPSKIESDDKQVLAVQTPEGYQFYLHREKVGCMVTAKDACLVMLWLESALSQLDKLYKYDNVPLGEGPEVKTQEETKDQFEIADTDGAPF